MSDFDSCKVKMLRLPETMANWPWPRVINPHYEEVKAATDAWFHGFKAFTPQSQRAFDKCDFALVTALFYPWVSKEHLRTACDLMNLFFVIDEYTDVESEPVVREMMDVVIDALKNPHKPRPEGEILLGKVAQEFWALGIKTASPGSQRRMVDGLIAYLESNVQQAADRDNNVFPTIDSYIHGRRQNVGTRALFAIIELALDLPNHIVHHPKIVELSDYITDLVFIDNDIVSYNKEQAVGDDYHNILTSVMHEHRIDIDRAMDWAAAYHEEHEKKFLDGLKHVPSWGPEMDRQVQQYLNGMAWLLRGNDCWNFESRRYFGSKGREIQMTRQVPLLSKIVPFRENATLRRENVVIPDIELLERGGYSI